MTQTYSFREILHGSSQVVSCELVRVLYEESKLEIYINLVILPVYVEKRFIDNGSAGAVPVDHGKVCCFHNFHNCSDFLDIKKKFDEKMKAPILDFTASAVLF